MFFKKKNRFFVSPKDNYSAYKAYRLNDERSIILTGIPDEKTMRKTWVSKYHNPATHLPYTYYKGYDIYKIIVSSDTDKARTMFYKCISPPVLAMCFCTTGDICGGLLMQNMYAEDMFTTEELHILFEREIWKLNTHTAFPIGVTEKDMSQAIFAVESLVAYLADTHIADIYGYSAISLLNKHLNMLESFNDTYKNENEYIDMRKETETHITATRLRIKMLTDYLKNKKDSFGIAV